HVVNHRQDNWGEALLDCTAGVRVERVVEVEFGANLPEVLKCVATGATIATYSSTVVKEPQLPFIQMMFMDLTLRMVLVYAMPEAAKRQAIADTCQLLEAGILQHRIAHRLSFEQMATSHELIERGGFGGCVVVAMT
ncbi:MAG: zinc-binding dehydrogenase, partial [Desulfobacterales bacterium]|nr:zinc-binding dehydrogenase [Desulfobacterales bacterium]